jgi:hypothetical protein
MSHQSPRMGMPEEQEITGGKVRSRMPRMKVTSMATEVASSARRTNDGVFVCPSEFSPLYHLRTWLISQYLDVVRRLLDIST